MRLDQELVFRKIYPTRAKAVAAIKAGLVSVNDRLAGKASMSVVESDVIVGGDLPYSSGRGSLKLEKALDYFGISVKGLVCLDVGSSTGGFTEVLLRRGAEKVIAVDVGTDQMIPELRDNPKVSLFENTDIRKLKPFVRVDLIVVDVSFISLTNVAENLVAWGAKKIVVLIKPQFEVAREIAAKCHGVIKSEIDRQNAITKVQKCFSDLGFSCGEVIESPILGGSGNVEFLTCFEKVKN